MSDLENEPKPSTWLWAGAAAAATRGSGIAGAAASRATSAAIAFTRGIAVPSGGAGGAVAARLGGAFVALAVDLRGADLRRLDAVFGLDFFLEAMVHLPTKSDHEMGAGGLERSQYDRLANNSMRSARIVCHPAAAAWAVTLPSLQPPV